MKLTFVSERLSPDDALDKIDALGARLPRAMSVKVAALRSPWPPEDPLSRGYDVIELTAEASAKHAATLWRIAKTFHYLKAWCDYHVHGERGGHLRGDARPGFAEGEALHLAAPLGGGALVGGPGVIDWTQPDREALLVAGLLPGTASQDERDALQAIALALLGYQAHLDYAAGYAAALAAPPDAVVKPGDRIQDMEAAHRDGRIRVMRVDQVVFRDSHPYAQCSHTIAGRSGTRVRLDRIHRKNIKTGWRVLDGEGA